MFLKKHRNVFIGGRWMDSQLLYLIPIVDGYCKEKKIDTIYFERKNIKKIQENEIINSILKNYNVIYCPRDSYFLLRSFRKPLRVAIFIIKKMALKRADLLGNQDWHSSQIEHGIWDLSVNYSPDGCLNPTFFNKFRSIIKSLTAIDKAGWLLESGTQAAFLGHTVYDMRSLLAVLRERISVFSHSAYHIYRLPKLYDLSATRFEINFLENALGEIDDNAVKQYWDNRLNGYSAYEDVNAARDKPPLSLINVNENIIMLHIFRDSPFNYIEPSRIFADYIDWINHTLGIIAKAKSNWVIKFHPSAGRWGENQKVWVDSILRRSNISLPNNVSIDTETSNFEMLKNAKKIITYAGTSHLEASAFGIKPIVIDGTTLDDYCPFSVHKPKNIKEYEDLINEPYSEFFKQKLDVVNFSKQLIYIREIYSNLRSEVGGLTVYRGDIQDVFDRDFELTAGKVKNHLAFLNRLGGEFAKGLMHTVRKIEV
ncbi:hypothetical protein FD977_01665 [Polynucleobacter sp. AP-Elch-400A-B2]|uniref:hypothetical protein n=1 Tax=Polynucleobacter sp. AP-Elch-400A-B2 TaxID=2576930 RepID=UPI001BFDDB9F|nr:hypothetical protein [Polynucleobacter sp. AP-Elch-400A-B2]QWE24993.1 hypothetical protein FD977_01665 [Polynucleobacter sp. AP-Elch-400A-B2]